MEYKTIYFKNGSSTTPIGNSEDIVKSKEREILISGINISPEDVIGLIEGYSENRLYWYQKMRLKLIWSFSWKF
jgi:hypothetical protein